jgi:hypothetical protein
VRAAVLAALACLAPVAAWAQDGWYRQGAFQPVERVAVTLVNELPVARKAAGVVITPDQVPSLRGVHELSVTLVDPAAPGRPEPSQRQKAQEGAHGRVAEQNGRSFDYQLDDLDKDGLWDELFLQLDFAPRERKTIHIYRGFNERGWNPHRTHAAIGSYMRHLVPFWESEHVGWKLWYPTDVDVYGKRDGVLMSPRLYIGNLDGYAVSYEDPRYGSDIQTVADSFGAAGIGVIEDPGRPAHVSRPRFTARSDRKANFNGDPLTDTRYAFDVVTNGPLRSTVRIRTMNWDSGAGRYAVEQTYTAYAGQNYATATARFSQFAPNRPGAAFAVGMRKKDGETLFHQAGGIAVTAAPEAIRNPDDVDAVQNELKVAYAGTALVVKDSYRPQYVFTPEFSGNHMFRIAPNPDRRFEYMIAAA